MNSLLACPRRLALVAAGVVGASLVTGLHTRALAVPTPVAAPSALDMPDFADITAHNGPAVVNISVSVDSLAGKNYLRRSCVS